MDIKLQNKAIADVLNLGPYQKRNREGFPSEDGQHIWHKECLNAGAFYMKPIPTFTGDLNACHVMKKILNKNQQVEYSIQLGKIALSQLPASRAAWVDYYLLNTTASQQAEAFLRTLNLWKP